MPGSEASRSGLLPLACRRLYEGRGRWESAPAPGGRITQGASGGGLGRGQWGLGRGLGAAWGVVQGLARGRGLPPGLATPHSLQVVPALGQAGDGEVAGRGLLASCLLSRGLISKTGRLVLTEAAGGTADVSARLSSWGPGSCPQAPGASHRPCPQMPSAPTRSHSPSAVPLAADQALRRGHLGPLCQLQGGWEPAEGGRQESGGAAGSQA